MSSFLNGLASAGLGYYKGMDEQRAMEERKAKQAQEKQLYDIRLQEAKNNAEDNARARADQQTLRAAARPVQATEDGSGGMVRPDTMDNRDVGLAENAGLPNQGLVQSRYNVAGQRFADKTAADAYAQTQNTPDMQASRYATAQRGIGDVAGAYKTESEQRARKKLSEVDAMDNMLKDFGKALYSGGPKALAEMASKSNADGSDYQHETGPNGEDAYYRVSRSTKQRTLIGTFPSNEQGRVEAYKAFAATVSPELAMKHYAEKKAEARKDKEDKRKEDEDKSQAGLRSAQARSADANAGESSAKARLYGTQADAGGYRPGGGGGGKVDHFDEKEWSSAYSKMDKTAVSIPNEMGDKDVVHPDLSAARRAIFNEVRAAGGYNPAQAVELADEKVLALRRRAMEMVEASRANDKKSTLTVDKAITDLLRRAQSASGLARQPDAAVPLQNTPPATKPAAAAGLANATQYTPPPNSPAAKALQERKAAQEKTDAQREEARAYQKKKLIDDEAALKMQTEEYKRRNNLR
jgi:hypothetical protein